MSEQKLIITFATTTAAIAWEQVCKAEGLPGRLIPVPPRFKAGCGLAWLTVSSYRLALLEASNEFDLSYEEIYEMNEG